MRGIGEGNAMAMVTIDVVHGLRASCQFMLGDGRVSHHLLQQSAKQQAPSDGGPPIEAEHEFVEIPCRRSALTAPWCVPRSRLFSKDATRWTWGRRFLPRWGYGVIPCGCSRGPEVRRSWLAHRSRRCCRAQQGYQSCPAASASKRENFRQFSAPKRSLWPFPVAH